MIRKMILLFAIFLFALPCARADDVSKRAKIEEMFTILRMDSLMKQMMTQNLAHSKEMVRGMLGDTEMTPSDRKIVDDYLAKVLTSLSEKLSWESIKSSYIEIYASTYTEDEIDGILGFYKSPSGQAFLAKKSELVTKTGATIGERMQDLNPRIRELTTEFQKQIQAAHPNKPVVK